MYLLATKYMSKKPHHSIKKVNEVNNQGYNSKQKNIIWSPIYIKTLKSGLIKCINISAVSTDEC